MAHEWSACNAPQSPDKSSEKAFAQLIPAWMSQWDLEGSRKPPNRTFNLPEDAGFHGAGERIPPSGSIRQSVVHSGNLSATCKGGVREREGDGASSVTMAGHSQSGWKLFPARHTHNRRALLNHPGDPV